MLRAFNKRARCLIPGFCFVVALSAASAALGKALSIKEIMLGLAKHHAACAAALEKGRLDAELGGHLAALDGLYRELGAGAGKDGAAHDPAAWEGLCDRSLAAVLDTEASVRAGDEKAARTAFARLEALRDEAHRRFKPGLFRRLGRLLFGKREESHQ